MFIDTERNVEALRQEGHVNVKANAKIHTALRTKGVDARPRSPLKVGSKLLIPLEASLSLFSSFLSFAM